MKPDAVELPLGGGQDLAGLEPIERIRRRWPVLLGALLSGLMILGLGRELLGGGMAGLWRTVPQNPLFYVAFAGAYLVLPVADYVIYRRLWRLPFVGLGALIRKRIVNDVVIGYSGDLYFYVWARQRLKMATSPFGAVKDVTILSGIAGNGITLAMMAVVLPYASDLFTRSDFRMIAQSAVIIFLFSAPFVIFSRRVFSLPRSTLFWITLVHCARIAADSTLLALAWHLAMPEISIWMWLFLSAARLLVLRLPLVPGKDLLFATFAIIFIGQSEALRDLIAFVAAMTLVAHIALAAAFGLYTLMRKER